MEDSLEYIGEIVPKPRMTRADTWKHRPIVDRYYAFKDSIVLQAKQQDFVLGEAFSIIFKMPMPSSWSKVKMEQYDELPHRQRPDIDNLCKAVMDSLLKEDSGVWSINATKVWTSGKPRIIIMNYDEPDKEDVLNDIE